jgi:hypothetical protein
MVAITHPSFRPAPTGAARFGPSASAATYRRRRLALLGALLVVLALASVALQLLAGAADGGDARPVARVSVVVAPGDTVWSIATGLAPEGDPRPVVDAIVDANGGSSLVAGQRLEVVLP